MQSQRIAVRLYFLYATACGRKQNITAYSPPAGLQNNKQLHKETAMRDFIDQDNEIIAEFKRLH